MTHTVVRIGYQIRRGLVDYMLLTGLWVAISVVLVRTEGIKDVVVWLAEIARLTIFELRYWC